jgi:hypothetical protein
MPNVSKTLFRGAATTTTSTTLYTVPAATTAVVTSIVVTNTSGTDETFTLALAGVNLANTVTAGANDSVVIDLKQVLAATETITGGASSTSVNLHVAGVEIS